MSQWLYLNDEKCMFISNLVMNVWLTVELAVGPNVEADNPVFNFENDAFLESSCSFPRSKKARRPRANKNTIRRGTEKERDLFPSSSSLSPPRDVEASRCTPLGWQRGGETKRTRETWGRRRRKKIKKNRRGARKRKTDDCGFEVSGKGRRSGMQG